MKLYLLRHAKTDQNSPSGQDFDRQLLPKGRKQCSLMQSHLNTITGITVWCSSAARTRETHKLITLKDANVTFEDELYLCGLNTFLEKIWKHEGSDDLFIVGHNYGISQLASYFTEDYIEMRTCELICINFDIDNWGATSRGNGTIIDRFRPQVF